MPNNLSDKIRELEGKMEEVNRLVEKLKKPKEERGEPIEEMPVKKGIWLENINGLFQTVSTTPTHTPRNLKEQIVLVDSGSITKMYIHFGSAWKLQRFYNT